MGAKRKPRALIKELAAKIPSVSTIKPGAQLKFAEGATGFNEIAQTVGHKPTFIDRILGRQRIPLQTVNEFAKQHK